MRGCGARLVWLLVLGLAWLGSVLGDEEKDGEVVAEEEDEILSDELGEEDGVLVLHEHNFARALSEHQLLLVEFCKCPTVGRGMGRTRHGCECRKGHRMGMWAGAQGMDVTGQDMGHGMGTGTQSSDTGRGMGQGKCNGNGTQGTGTWLGCRTCALEQGTLAGAQARAQCAHTAFTCPGSLPSLPWGPTASPCPQTRPGAGTAGGWPLPTRRQPQR